MHLVMFGMVRKSEKCSFDPYIKHYHTAIYSGEILLLPMLVSSCLRLQNVLNGRNGCRVHSTVQGLPHNNSERNNWIFFVL